MKLKLWHYLVFAAIIIFLIMESIKKSTTGIFDELANLLMRFEGFSSNPYWDVSRWSWGYGTEVPDSTSDENIRPDGTINRDSAMSDALQFSENNYNTLLNRITVPMTNNQWAALLSFAYNLGIGNALKLVPNINNRDNAALGTQWNEYIYAGGVVNDNLVARRKAEYNLFGNL